MMNKLRFVFDANVIISGFLFKNSKPRYSLEIVKNNGIILISEPIITEISNVLSRPKFDRYITIDKRQELLQNFIDSSLLIEPMETIDICRDIKDNKYLELSIAGKAESIITGDEDLLVLNPFRGIKIITVQEFLDGGFTEVFR